MLKFIRRNADAPWVKIIFVAIVVVFIFWGMGGIVGGEKAQVVARVNNDGIEPVEFYRAYNSLLRLYQDIYKDNFKPEMLKGFDLKNRAMDQIIRVNLMKHEAQRIGLRVSETEVRDAIAGMSTFQANGRFNKDLYLRALRANQLTPGEFEDAEGQDLLVRKLQSLIEAGVNVSEAEVRERYNFDNEKVSLRVVKFDAPTFLPEVQLSDQDVQAYFDTHQETFREPERVRLEYVLYDPETFTDKVDHSDAATQQYFERHRAEYQKPEQVRARHILFKLPPDTADELKAAVRKHAEEVLAKVKAGEDFAALAKQYSEDSSAADGGDLGFFEHGKMVQPFEEAAFALAPGATSDIVESPFGFHIIKVEAKEEAHEQTLDEARDKVVAALTKEKARELARTQADTERAKAATGEALAKLVEGTGLPVTQPAPFAQNESVPALGRYPDFAKAAFATDAGAVGPVVDIPNGFVVFRLLEKIATHVPPLPEIREAVEKAARLERAEGLAKTKADALLAEMQKGDIATAAAAANVKVEETTPFTRKETYIAPVGSSPDLAKDAFQLTAEKPVAPKVYTVSGSSVVAALKERTPADEENYKTEKGNLKRQAEERRKQQVLEEFVNYLKAHASIEVSQDFLASVSETGRQTDGAPRRRR